MINVIQYYRGIAIIAVIMIHTIPISSDGNFPDFCYYLFFRNAINFPVPLFFAISGFLVPFTTDKKWVKTRVKRLLFPYLIWSIIYIVLKILANHSLTVIDIISQLSVGSAAPPFYFIVLLLCFTIITPYINKKCIDCDKRFFYSLLSLNLLFILAAYYYQFKYNYGWACLKYSTVYLPFYIYGLMCRKKGFALSYSWLILLFYSLSIMESIILLQSNNTALIAFGQMRFSALLFAFSITGVVMQNLLRREAVSFYSKKVKFIGDYSEGLFYIHMIYIIIFRILFENYFYKICLPLFFVELFQLIFTLALSMLSLMILKKILSANIINRLIGLRC